MRNCIYLIIFFSSLFLEVGYASDATPNASASRGHSETCAVLKKNMKLAHKHVLDHHNRAVTGEVHTRPSKILPANFRLDKDEMNSSSCVEELGPDECDGRTMMTTMFSAKRMLTDVGTGWELNYVGNFGRLSSGIYQGMRQDELVSRLGKPYHRNELVVSYRTISEFYNEPGSEELFFYFIEGKLFAIRNHNGTGC